jgi:hypothetical protein
MVYARMSKKNQVELALIAIDNLYYLSDKSIELNYQWTLSPLIATVLQSPLEPKTLVKV